MFIDSAITCTRGWNHLFFIVFDIAIQVGFNSIDFIIDCELGIDSLNHLIIGVACHAAQSFWTNSLPDHVSYKRASSIVAGYRLKERLSNFFLS